MHPVLPRLLFSIWLLLFSALAQAELNKLDKSAIFELFDNRTAEAYQSMQGFSFLAYFSADGRITGMHKGRFFSSQWKVTDQDQICILYPLRRGQTEVCHFVLKDDKNTYFYKTLDTEQMPDYTFTGFAAGNTNNF